MSGYYSMSFLKIKQKIILIMAAGYGEGEIHRAKKDCWYFVAEVYNLCGNGPR
jgi:hypothetical protein